MARLPFDIESLLSMPSAYDQIEQAIRLLREVIQTTQPDAAAGVAIAVVESWQSRFEDLLHSEIPDWACLAAFRSITDFNIDPSRHDPFKDVAITQPSGADVPETLKTWEELKNAYSEYFACRDLYSGKFTVAGEPANDLVRQMYQFRLTVGGQAGNILWLLSSINGNGRGYVPYLSGRLQAIPEIGETKFLSLDSAGARWAPLRSLQPGIVSTLSEERPPAPSGASFVIAQLGRRMILQLPGFRVVQPGAPAVLPFEAAQYRLNGQPLAPPIPKDNVEVWPQVPFFARIWIEGTVLVIDILDDDRLRDAFQSQPGGLAAQQAIVGGLNALFNQKDPWLNRAEPLRSRLAQLAEQQMRCLRSCGIRIGAELSGRPDRDYSEMLKRLCGEGAIVGLGINGEDELPEITNFTAGGQAGGTSRSVPPVSYDFYLDLAEVPTELRAAERDKTSAAFPYITYLRARKLARALGVRTLYVHTNSIDMALRRSADPGSLVQAQRAAFLGKGLVIAALMKRSYPEDWMRQLPDMPLAVNPEAMVKLWNFALHFDKHQARGSFETLVTTGLWINPDDGDYSLALVPVLWPSLADRNKMPPGLNTTGAGDMTFGAFFYLGGI